MLHGGLVGQRGGYVNTDYYNRGRNLRSFLLAASLGVMAPPGNMRDCFTKPTLAGQCTTGRAAPSLLPFVLVLHCGLARAVSDKEQAQMQILFTAVSLPLTIQTPALPPAPQACNRMSYMCVPLYDSLGENAIEFIVRHAEVRGLAPLPCCGPQHVLAFWE